MNAQKRGFGRTTATWVILMVVGAVLAVWGYFYFENMSAGREVPSPPSTEWTTAPEGGVAVELPETPMSDAPAPEPGRSR